MIHLCEWASDDFCGLSRGAFFIVFFIVLMALFRIDMLDSVQHFAIQPWTGFVAHLSVWLMSAFDADVVAFGKIIQSKATGFAVSIEAGCNGIEAAIVLVAGMVAFPAAWKYKVGGIVIGFVAVQSVNLLRIITLYYVGQWNARVFEFAHLYFWQALIMLDVLVVWLVWIRVVAKHHVTAPS